MAFKLNRRAMLKGAGAVGIGLPLLQAMEAKGQGAVAPKRFVVFHTHNGVAQETYAMNGTETDFQLSETLEPLERHKDGILFFEGVDNEVSRIGDPDNAHERGTNCVLTGGLGTINENGSSPDNFFGPSIDQAMVQALRPATKFQSLTLGLGALDTSRRTGLPIIPTAISADQPLLPDNNPVSVFDRLFADLPENSGETPAPTFDPIRQGNLSVLDFTMERIQRLQQRLGAEDRARLDQHLTAVRDLETTLNVSVDPIACDRPSAPLAVAYEEDSAYPTVLQSMFDLTARAFACDLTRIVTISALDRNLSHSFAGESGAWHNNVSHRAQSRNGDPAGYITGVTKINKWYMEQFAYFFDELKRIPEGDATVFDNTAFLWTMDVSMGSTHRQNNMPFIVAGSCGGYFRTGRFMRYDGESHNKLLVSLLNAMGVDTNEFGLPGYSGGPLAGLTA